MNKKAIFITIVLLWMVACAPAAQDTTQSETFVARSAALEKTIAPDSNADSTPATPLPTPQIVAIEVEADKAIEIEVQSVTPEEIKDSLMTESNAESINSTRPESEKEEDNSVIVSEPVQPVTVDLSNLSESSNRDDEVGSAPQVMPMPGVPDQTTQIIHNIRQDLAQRLNIDISQTAWIETKPMEWGDSSLGCPQPNMAYAAVMTPGYRIVVRANGEDFVYHTDTNNIFVLCQP